MVKFSLLLILIALALLGITLAPVISPNNSTLLNLLEPILCASGDNLIQQVSPLARNDGSSATSFTASTTLLCQPASGELINVTDKMFGIGLTAFLVFLIFGVLFLIVGLIRNSTQPSQSEVVTTPAAASPFYTPPAAAPPSTNFATQVSIPRQPSRRAGYPASPGYAAPAASSHEAPSEKFDFESAPTMMSIPKAPPAPATPAQPPAGSSDLAARLKQLKDAFDAGLISQEEYDRSRSNLLHDFTDDN